MIMPINLVLSYLISLLGIKFVYKDKIDQKEQISLGLFLGSIVALITLIIYFITGIKEIYVPIIFSALILIYEYYSLRKINEESVDFSQYYVNKQQENKTDVIIDDEKEDNKVSLLLDDEDIGKNTEIKDENKKLSIDDIIKE